MTMEQPTMFLRTLIFGFLGVGFMSTGVAIASLIFSSQPLPGRYWIWTVAVGVLVGVVVNLIAEFFHLYKKDWLSALFGRGRDSE